MENLPVEVESFSLKKILEKEEDKLDYLMRTIDEVIKEKEGTDKIIIQKDNEKIIFLRKTKRNVAKIKFPFCKFMPTEKKISSIKRAVLSILKSWNVEFEENINYISFNKGDVEYKINF